MIRKIQRPVKIIKVEKVVKAKEPAKAKPIQPVLLDKDKPVRPTEPPPLIERKRGRPKKIKAITTPIYTASPQNLQTETKTPVSTSTKRQAITAAIVGTTGSGKSTKAIEVAKKLAGKNQNILILTHNFEPEIWRQFPQVKVNKEALTTSGPRVIRVCELGENETFAEIEKYFRNGVIIMDDCKQYIDNGFDQGGPFKNIVINHRHKGLDIIFIAHSPEEIPPRLWGYIKFAFVGVCNTEIKKANFRAQEKDAFFEALKKARETMKERAARGQENPHAGIFIEVLLTNI